MNPHTPLLNRELGVLEFNARVLSQAEDPKTPLLERLRFISIVSSNMDEFFEIRMAGLKEHLRENPSKILAGGLSVQESYDRVSARAHELVTKKRLLLQEDIIPKLAKEKIAFHMTSTWNEKQRLWARQFFRRELVPLLTPIALDPALAFPRFSRQLILSTMNRRSVYETNQIHS